MNARTGPLSFMLTLSSAAEAGSITTMLDVGTIARIAAHSADQSGPGPCLRSPSNPMYSGLGSGQSLLFC